MVAIAEQQRAALRTEARWQLLALAIATIGLLLGGAYATLHVGRSLDQLVRATNLARDQSAAVSLIRASVRDAQSGQRSFLLTGNDIYLDSYTATHDTIDHLLAQLTELTANDDKLRPEAARLSLLAHAKLDEVQRTIDLERAGNRAAAIALIDTSNARAIMQELRELTVRMVNETDAKRLAQSGRLQHDQMAISTVLLAGLGGGIALLAGIAAMLILNRMRLQQARAGERREAERLHATVEHIPDGVAVFDSQGCMAVVNARFASTLGANPAIATLDTPYRTVAASVTLEPSVLDEERAIRPGMVEVRQGDRSLEVWRTPLPDGGQLVAVADITRRVAAEEAARVSQRMDVLGQMTGGVAHDFNNLLQVISANLELLRNRLARAPGNEALLARLDAAAGGVARGTKLTRHLLAFARRQPLAPESIDAARLLMGLEDMLRRTIGEGVQLELAIGSGLWLMRADPAQFENALLNLALNARDAMTGPDATPKGLLTIEAVNASLDEAYAARAADVSPGQYVMFVVTDTGSGMTEEQRARAVEPFYTTKPEGRGTGLGLSMVLGFAKQSGGHFQLYSEPGHGTTARLYIPRTTAPAQHHELAPAELPLGSGQLVLVVEDDPAVRLVARDALLALNYQVTEADSADAGLAMLEAGLRPSLLFTDVVMPGQISARRMTERAREIMPGLGVLFTSGYTQNSIVHNGQLDADVALISKPWRQDELARALRSVLDGTATRPPPRRRILLVEDDKLVRSTTADALAEIGFEVVEVGTAEAAMARLQPPPDLLITDFGLPDQDGVSLAGQVRIIIPGLPVVLSSGRSSRNSDGLVWLPKPYDMQALRRALTEALGPLPAP